ncbi:serine acetyltransferase [Pedobacter changchengzhani]|uniref:Serine acetyltransferase n=1 Tax=Pedobacter changchengzhani TaxID=2529274 RepID=A0A4R5MJT9_9SPHI|nr:serine acetyltransferase [Pedobacter changchengzhani]TDG35802.1 serine acetyltransferase [Pedobacter changchengzhani]
MNEDFYKLLLEKPAYNQSIPSNKIIAKWAEGIIHLMFPENCTKTFKDLESIKKQALSLQEDLVKILSSCEEENEKFKVVANLFFDGLPELYRVLNTDIQAIYDGDPAANSEFEVVRTYPGFYAICFYRIAHLLSSFDIALIPRILTEYAHSKTGIDIHPSAIIGEYFNIDHGTGIVIGETSTLGKHVKIFQGVTLGALSVRKSLAGSKRHPTVEDHVVIYSGATILGGETVIGNHSVIGGNVWLTESIAPFSTVYHSPVIKIINEIRSSK